MAVTIKEALPIQWSSGCRGGWGYHSGPSHSDGCCDCEFGLCWGALSVNAWGHLNLLCSFQFHLCATFFQENPVPSSPFGAMITVKSAKQVIKPNSKHFRTTVGSKVHGNRVGGGHR